MTPLSFEWKWAADYLIFMGLLYLALAAIGCGLVFVWVRTWLDLQRKEKGEKSLPEIPYRQKYPQY
jgi:hypothetical protein